MRFLADEDFNGRILRGLLLRNDKLNLVRVQDVGLSGAGDEKLPEWASDNDRIVLTHDARTMPRHVAERLDAGFHVPGVFVVDDLARIGTCIDHLLLIVECSDASEWRDWVCYLPFR